ncbi:ERCC4 domain-containing protein [Vulcanisaeta thermophila]|uniref:ERCC4 domain-containing protein n=1 Tax=Vulcanisaeta thermophila TaxID=867917 RepID=UPI00085394F8|nr:ERCC4 domain-containing protein [Vulcanisaeta thermophila]
MPCTVIVDSREYETAEEVIKWLKRYECTVLPRRLEVGDYVVPGNVGIERKRAMDLISSIVDGRLFEQSNELSRAYDRAYVVIEGDLWRAASRRDVHEHAIISSLVSIINLGVRVLFTHNEEGTAYLIKTIAEGGSTHGVKSVPVRKGGTIYDAQIAFLSSLPGIGMRRAEALLRAFGTPLNALNNLNQWVRRVDGINEKVVAAVRKVLTTQYGNEEEQGTLRIDELIREGDNEGGESTGDAGDKEVNKSRGVGRRITDYMGGEE